MHKALVLLSLMLTATGAATAEDLTGRWTISSTGSSGSVFVLKQTGEQLTGVIEGAPGARTYKIVDGHVRGKQVFFFVLHEAPDDPEVIDNGGNPFHNVAKGTIEGDELKLAGSRENTKIREYQMTLKRVR